MAVLALLLLLRKRPRLDCGCIESAAAGAMAGASTVLSKVANAARGPAGSLAAVIVTGLGLLAAVIVTVFRALLLLL